MSTQPSFGITTDYTVSNVQIGVENATGAGTQPVTVNLYSTATGTFPAGALTNVGTTTVNIAAQADVLLDIPVVGTVPLGEDLVVEIFTPSGQGTGHGFFIGSNTAGETGASYLQAPACGAVAPTPIGSLGPFTMHVIMTVDGDTVDPTAPPVTILEVPNTGEIMITSANGQPAYDSPGGSVVRHNGGAELWLPQDFDGNGFDTYIITETVVVDGRTWYGIFIGNETWVYVPGDTVTVTR